MLPKNYKNKIQEMFVAIAWMQWRRLGVFASGAACRYSVDAENFLLFAALACRSDARLFENVVTWFYYYNECVQKERLSNLVKALNNDYVTRFVGALAESFAKSTWKNVIASCKKWSNEAAIGQEWMPAIPLHGDFVHPIFQKWGITMPKVQSDQKLGSLLPSFIPRNQNKTGPKGAEFSRGKMSARKLLDHNVIVQRNAILSYRYCFEPTTRADIWYLFSISMHLKERVEWDHLTCLRLASYLGVHDTTMYRIQKDFEKAGVLRIPEADEHKRFMWTWKAPTDKFPFVSQPLELGILHWTHFVTLMCELWAVVCNVEKSSNEIIAKSKLIDIQRKWDDWLIRHELESCDLLFDGVPLNQKSLQEIFDALLKSLGSFAKALCGSRPHRR